jgi:hypothetical protein
VPAQEKHDKHDDRDNDDGSETYKHWWLPEESGRPPRRRPVSGRFECFASVRSPLVMVTAGCHSRLMPLAWANRP